MLVCQRSLVHNPPQLCLFPHRYGAPLTAKESTLKGFRNRLKVFGRGTSLSRSTSPPAIVAPPAVFAAPPTVATPPADLASIVSTITTDLEKATKFRAKYTHFRIGRANAGKTTLLCNTKEDPFYSEVRYPLRSISHSHLPSPTN